MRWGCALFWCSCYSMTVHVHHHCVFFTCVKSCARPPLFCSQSVTVTPTAAKYHVSMRSAAKTKVKVKNCSAVSDPAVCVSLAWRQVPVCTCWPNQNTWWRNKQKAGWLDAVRGKEEQRAELPPGEITQWWWRMFTNRTDTRNFSCFLDLEVLRLWLQIRCTQTPGLTRKKRAAGENPSRQMWTCLMLCCLTVQWK